MCPRQRGQRDAPRIYLALALRARARGLSVLMTLRHLVEYNLRILHVDAPAGSRQPSVQGESNVLL
jgi:hypothetical protein